MRKIGQFIRQFNRRIARSIAPRTFENLEYISRYRDGSETSIARLVTLEENLTALAAELNDIRRDERRMAELYDLVFEYVRDSADSQRHAPATRLAEDRDADS